MNISGLTTAVAFGDSYTYGLPTPPSGQQIFCSNHGISLTNLGAGGATSLAISSQMWPNLPLNYSGLALLGQVGLNDLAVASPAFTKITEKIKGVVRSFIAAAFTSSWVQASTVCPAGLYGTAPHVRSYGVSGKGITNVTPANPITYSFNGTNVVVGFFGCSSTGAAPNLFCPFNIIVDGITVATIDPNELSDGNGGSSVMPNCRLINGLSSGAHTLQIVATSSAGVLIDWVGTLKDPATCAPIVISELCHLSAEGLVNFGNGISNSIIDNINAGIEAVAAEFAAWPVNVAMTNNFYSPASDAGTGGSNAYHPNSTTGYPHIAAAMEALVTPPLYSTGQILYETSNPLNCVIAKLDGTVIKSI